MPTIYNFNQLEGFAANAGFTGDQIPIMAAIALAESSGNPNKYNPDDPGGSVGLWQIDGHYWPQYDQNVITDPQANADAAFAIFQAQGYRAWTTFGSGAFLDHLDPNTATQVASTLGISRFNVLNTPVAPQVGNIIGPNTTGTNYGLSAADLTPPLQVPEPSLSATPWYLDRNLVTGNPHARGMVQPVSFVVYLDRNDPTQTLNNPTNQQPIVIELNTSMTTFEIASKHVYNRTPSRTGMHITLWGMQPDLINGSGTTGVFMNQYGITDWFSTAQINDEIAKLVGAGFSNNPDTERAINQNPEAYRVAAQDCFVEFLKLFQMNGNVWYHTDSYNGTMGEQEQQAPNGWSTKVGASSFQQHGRNNDVMTRGYVGMKYRNNVYLGYFKSLNWTQDADSPFQWKFSFTFQVENTYTSLYYPNFQVTQPLPKINLLAQATTQPIVTLTERGGSASVGGLTTTMVTSATNTIAQTLGPVQTTTSGPVGDI